MHRGDAGEIGDLVPAGSARRDEHGSWRHGPRRGQQLAFGDRARHVVVIPRIAERTGHAAAAGVEIDDRRRGNSRQQRLGRRRQPHRSLMAMRMEQDVGRPRLQAQASRGPQRIPVRRTLRRAPTAAPPLARGVAARRAADPPRPRGPPTGSSVRRTRSPGRARPRRRARGRSPRQARRASDRRPCEINGRPQHTFGATLVVMPAAFITSIAARPISGSA